MYRLLLVSFMLFSVNSFGNNPNLLAFESLSNEDKELAVELQGKVSDCREASCAVGAITEQLEKLEEKAESNLTPENLLTMTLDLDFEEKGNFFYQPEYHNIFIDFLKKNPDEGQLDVILAYISDLNQIKDVQGQGLIFNFAEMSSNKGTSIFNNATYLESKFKEAMKTLELLLDKGLELDAEDADGNDALTVALLNWNTHVIELFQKRLASDNPPKLSQFTLDLLNVYEGKDADYQKYSNDEKEKLYRVANHGHNKAFVKKFYDNELKEQLDGYHASLKEDYYFFPPLWSYNIVQMEEYAKSVLAQIKDRLITADELVKLENGNYEFNKDGKKSILVKKEDEDIGRVLGRDHLSKIIQKTGKAASIAVPEKYILVPDKKKVEISIKVPDVNAQGILNFDHSLNGISVRINGAEVLAEYVESVDNKTESLNNNYNVRIVGEEAGFQDYGAGNMNFIRSKKDGKIYFIDTESAKNFVYKKMPRDAVNIKGLTFHPDITRFKFTLPLEEES